MLPDFNMSGCIRQIAVAIVFSLIFVFFYCQRVVAILPYTKMPDTDELTFQKGDIFFLHNDMGDGWLWVTAHR